MTKRGWAWYGAAMPVRGLVKRVALFASCLQFSIGCAAGSSTADTAQKAPANSQHESTPSSTPTSDSSAAKVASPQQPEQQSAADQQPITRNLELCSDVWSPYTDAQGKPRLALDLVHEALRRVGVTAATRMTEPGGVLPALQSHKYDGSAALWKSPDREQYLLYSEPYLQNRLVLLGRSDGNVGAQTLGELKGQRLGLVTTYSYGLKAEDLKDVKLVYGSSESENLQKLLKGEIDYMLVEELLVYHLFQSGGQKAKTLLKAGTKSLLTRGLYLALQKDLPGAREILRLFNEQVRQLVLDGTYNRVLNVSWLGSDADQDGQYELVLSGTAAGTAPPEQHYQLFGATAQSAPRFVIQGQTYQDWQSVPQQYKVSPQMALPEFEPGINLVLLDF